MTTCPDCRRGVENYTCSECGIKWRRERVRTSEGDWIWTTVVEPL